MNKPYRRLVAIAASAAAIASGALVGSTQSAASAATTPTVWKISSNGIGPAVIGMTAKQARASAAFTPSACGPQLKGATKVTWIMYRPARSSSVPQPGDKLSYISLNAANAAGHPVRTANGTRIGSTETYLRNHEAGLTRRAYVYEHGSPTYDKQINGRWLTYSVKRGVVTRIEVSTFRIMGGGGC